jgi:anti-anti-sigma factor
MISINNQPGQEIPQVNVTGRLDSATSSDFDRGLSSLAEREKFIIIDFSNCTYLSSAGIRVLLVLEKKLLARGGGLFLSALSTEVYQVLEMAGLTQVFHILDQAGSAQAEMERISAKNRTANDWTVGNVSFHFQPVTSEREPALIWNEPGIAGYDELNVSIGTGAAAETPAELEQALGFFITCCGCAGFIPNDASLPPDFRIPKNPAGAGILIDQALSFGDRPVGLVRLNDPASLTFSQLADAWYPMKFSLSDKHHDLMAMVIADFNPTAPSISLCLVIDRGLINTLKPTGLHEIPGLIQAGEPGIRLWGARFMLAAITDDQADLQFSKFLKRELSIENVVSVQFIHPGDLTVNPVAWIFVTDGITDASDRRLTIETTGDTILEPFKLFLARRLYTDSARIVIKPLHGGYSAQTYQVTSFDRKGRRMRPTVLKIANRAIINRESERCQRYALPYIMNNSAQVLGTEFFGAIGALRYNFVGIGGESSQLKWLTHYFQCWQPEQLEPLFDKIFLQILNPWYGQPIRETIFPYRDHDPRSTFFPSLCETAGETFFLSTDEQFVTIEETGRETVNPYWFLKHEFPRRRETGMEYLTSICHGDLNMQNILLDEDMNVYLIDFSETKPRSLISDFARLEAIFMIEHAAWTNLSEIAEYAQFLTRFYEDLRPGEMPVNSYQGEHMETVERSVRLTRKMREYAFAGVKGDPNPVPYCLAMLEWVLPVVCYTAPAATKRYSMIVAGLLCEIVMKND